MKSPKLILPVLVAMLLSIGIVSYSASAEETNNKPLLQTFLEDVTVLLKGVSYSEAEEKITLGNMVTIDQEAMEIENSLLVRGEAIITGDMSVVDANNDSVFSIKTGETSDEENGIKVTSMCFKEKCITGWPEETEEIWQAEDNTTYTTNKSISVGGTIKATRIETEAIIADNLVMAKTSFQGKEGSETQMRPIEGSFCGITKISVSSSAYDNNQGYSCSIKEKGGFYHLEGNCSATCITYPVGNIKSYYGCLSLGGTPYNSSASTSEPNEYQFCKFSGDTCPTSWGPYLNWRTTKAHTCDHDSSGMCKTECTTGSQSFSNKDPSTGNCQYMRRVYVPFRCKDSHMLTCQPKITEIGCQ